MRHILILMVFICALASCKSTSQNDIVSVNGSHIFINETQYIIKGICYHPVPKGSPNNRSWETLSQDLALMNEAGINTIRVYEPIDNINVLDEIDKAGIKVIIGFGYNQGGKNDIESGSFIDYVKKYKNHNAILLWELGNEYNYHPEWFGNDIKNWYNEMNAAAGLINKTDSNHLTPLQHMEICLINVALWT